MKNIIGRLIGKIYYAILSRMKQNGVVFNVITSLMCLKQYNRKWTRLVKENEKFKDIHKGERCFILGNGPSLNNVDFSLLQDEQVFTVNSLMQHSDFDRLKSNYHLWMDFNGFGLRKELGTDPTVFFQQMRLLEKQKDIVFFVPAIAEEVIKREGIDKKIDVHYISTVLSRKKIDSIDISKFSIQFYTVVQYAIEVAIYMGFSEIYLLGCDTTVLKGIIDTALGDDISNLHAYEEDEDNTQKKAFEALLKTNGFRFALLDTLNVLEGYDRLNDYCKENGIKLVNLSEPTLIDSIERQHLNSVLKLG